MNNVGYFFVSLVFLVLAVQSFKNRRYSKVTRLLLSLTAVGAFLVATISQATKSGNAIPMVLLVAAIIGGILFIRQSLRGNVG